MKNLGIAALAVVLVLTGCSAQGNDAKSIDLCVQDAEEQLDGVSLNTSDLEALNMGDALFESGIKDERDTDDANALYVVSGDVTWTDDGTEHRKTMVCNVKFEDGDPTVDASLG